MCISVKLNKANFGWLMLDCSWRMARGQETVVGRDGGSVAPGPVDRPLLGLEPGAIKHLLLIIDQIINCEIINQSGNKWRQVLLNIAECQVYP